MNQMLDLQGKNLHEQMIMYAIKKYKSKEKAGLQCWQVVLYIQS